MKLWQKDYDLNKEIEKFTVGSDYVLDRELFEADVAGSIAHAKMLEKIGVLSSEESEKLQKTLIGFLALARGGHVEIKVEDEDVHTVVEDYLVKKLQFLGKKLHTGRSRNDQVAVDMRLYGKKKLFAIGEKVLSLAGTLGEMAERHKDIPMPGRTHFQLAMPSSVGLWAGAFAEGLLDDFEILKKAADVIDQSPLGSAAGFGVPLELDREYVAELLGFAKVQNNVLYAANSRGKFESVILGALNQIMLDLAKLANDLIIFSAPEFGYFTIPAQLCTGSSIMPQKSNPCALELVRAKSSTVSACLFQVISIIRALPSGYNRDFQETKEPFMKGLDITDASLAITELTIEKLSVNEEKLLAGFKPEIFAAEAAIELAKEGVPFRDAYKDVAANLDKLKAADPKENILSKKHTGGPGNLGLEKLKTRAESESKLLQEKKSAFEKCISSLLRVGNALH